ncbi:MAG: restriction endonuclease subunit S [Pseudomonadaceae bacterium]
MSFPAYPANKYSGCEWIGDIPDHWSANPLKRAFKIEGGSTPTPDEVNWDGDIVWVTPADLSGQSSLFLDASKRTITATGLASSGTTLLPAGSLILSTRAPIGSLAIALIRVCTNQGCKGLVPNADASSAYFAYVLLTAKAELNNRGKGTTFLEISGDELGRFEVPIPPFPEQTQIARFLDHETARIDALIEEQQRLIELLKEKRQAVISHAVTKGLDPTVPMKDSGVEWLGEVPVHWEVTKFKWPLRTASGGTPPSSDREAYYDGGIPWLRSLDLTDDLVIEHEVTVTPRAVEETACKIVPKSSVLIAMYGGDGTIGKNGLLTFDSAINQAICAFLPSDRCAPEYLHRYIQFYRPYWMIGAESSRKDPNIGQDRIGDHFLVLPPLQEQSEIVAFLDVELLKFSALVEEAQTGVEFLQERRSALISAAVTGKIDVRGWQPPVSTQAPESAVAEAH